MVYIFDEPSMGELNAPPRLSIEDGFGEPIRSTRGIAPPGQKGYYKSWDSPIGLSVDRDRARRWRARNALAIRKLANRLEAPPGTDFHQLLRLAHGLPLSAPPHEARSDRNEDHRWVAEFEWELEERGLSYPSNLEDLLDAYSARQKANRNFGVAEEEFTVWWDEDEVAKPKGSEESRGGWLANLKKLRDQAR